MDRLPSSIMLEIFSRVPVKYLARSRCVSKVWCKYIDDRYLTMVHDERGIEEPTPIVYHTRLSPDKRIVTGLCFRVIESKPLGPVDDSYVLVPKKVPCLEFLGKKPLVESSDVKIEIRGSCNGLIYLSQDEDNVATSLVVVNLLRKECYEVPPLPMRSDRFMLPKECCGLGFDASTNTLKMVCVLHAPGDHDMVTKNLCTMVHVLGTNSWREIPQVPPYRIKGGAVYANGCLHWLASYDDIKTEDGGRHVIWFDVEKEEFGLIDPPKRMCGLRRKYRNCYYDHLVDLNGEVGYVCVRTMEIWVLKQKEWVPYCRINTEIAPYGFIRVLGCWNNHGRMLIINRGKNGLENFYVYNPKSGVLHRTFIHSAYNLNIIMHTNKLFLIRGIGTNSFPMRKSDLKKMLGNLHSLVA